VTVVALLLAALGALCVGTPAEGRLVRLRGVVEGYYGRPWPHAARRDVIRFLGTHGLNTFVYAPKNDPYHRERWRDPYPEESLRELQTTVAEARRARVRFLYAVSPVLDVCYACPDDFAALTAKLGQLARIGVRRFVLLYDDGGRLTAPEDIARYGGSDAPALARAQADLANRTRRWLGARQRGLAFIVPTDYAGTACRPYHVELANHLRRGVPVGWTGSGVFAREVTADEARGRAACLPGHPVVLWDNYPANDTFLSLNLHLGPLKGRSPGLARVLRGHLLNPMTQPHASLVAIGTAAAYFRDPEGYDPEAAWADTLAELSPGAGFGVLAAQLRSSVLDLDDARALAAAVSAVSGTYAGPDWRVGVDAVEAEEALQAAAPADIAAELGSTPLGEEIAPWVAELAAHTARGLEAVRLLRALKPALDDVAVSPTSGGLRIRGHARPPDAVLADALGPGFAAEAVGVAARIARFPVGDLFVCLGNPIGENIGFCPQFGLNVHGKVFYFLITAAGLETITDRNVHDRLVLATGAAYTEWVARRGPGADTLALALDGTPVPLAADGSFDVTHPASGGAQLLLTTAAGEATALRIP
jgi:hyaluronoglucosaminidase